MHYESTDFKSQTKRLLLQGYKRQTADKAAWLLSDTLRSQGFRSLTLDGGTKEPRWQESGWRAIKLPERTASGVTRVREWHDGVQAEAEKAEQLSEGYWRVAIRPLSTEQAERDCKCSLCQRVLSGRGRIHDEVQI
jgi:hypothetical protein